VTFTLNATLETLRSVDPIQVKSAVLSVLRDHFQLVPSAPTAHAVQPGVPASTRDIAALIRQVAGINRIIALSLVTAAGSVNPVPVPANGLVKLDLDNSQVTVARPGASGGAA
jgi:hypothetical protein